MGLLGKIWVKLGLDNSEFDKGIDETGKKSDTLKDTFKEVGTFIAAAFATDKILAFGKEIFALASKAEGVTAAFKRLAPPGLLDDLRKATLGTVDDFQLMQRAVQASNFKIPLDQLATYLQFATQRALETGQSVDYLVDSIITGLGRESVMILDNLGLSAASIRKEMEAGGSMAQAVGKLIQDEFKKSGDIAVTTAVKTAKLTTAFTNFKMEAGKGTTFIGNLEVSLAKIIDYAAKILSLSRQTENGKRGFWNMMFGKPQQIGATEADIKSEVDAAMKSVKTIADAEDALSTVRVSGISQFTIAMEKELNAFIAKENAAKSASASESKTNVESLQSIQDKIDLLKEELLITTNPDRQKAIVKEIAAKNKLIESILSAGEAEKATVKGSIQWYQYLISEIDKKILATTDRTVIESLENEKSGLQNLIKTWSMTTAEAKTYRAELEAIEKMRAEGAYFPLTVPKGRASVDAKGAGSVTFGTDTSGFEDAIFAAQLEQDLADMKAFNDKLQEETDRGAMIADQFGRAVADSISGSMKVIFDALMSGENIDASSLVKALVTPFADMAVQVGELLVATGVSALAMKAIGTVGGGIGAIAAGAALIALGTAAQASLSNIGGNFGSKGGGGANDYNYSGGGSLSSVGSAPPLQVEIVGRLSGQDIVLAGDNFRKNRAR